MTEYASIFNDVLAPVTPGPSSGCTGAPARIVHIGSQILGEPPVKMRIEMASNSSYADNLYGMRCDLSYITGLLDRQTTHPRFMNAYEDAKEAGLEIEFVFTEEKLAFASEVCRMYLTSASGRCMSFYNDSIGGGLFVISDIDGCPVKMEGYEYETLLFCDPMSAQDANRLKDHVKKICLRFNSMDYNEGNGSGILEIRSGDAFGAKILDDLSALEHVRFVRTAKPEHPVPRSIYRQPPFVTSMEMKEYAQKTGLPLWKLAVEYEKALSGWTEEQIMDYADFLWSTVEACAARGMEGKGTMNGIVPCRTPQIKEAFDSNLLIPLGAANIGAPYALSVMEDSNCSGTIVCIPTGGSAGIVPGAIYGACTSMGKDRSEMIKALLVSGLMGVFMYESRYNGGIGCWAETGCATGMAAGALVYLMGGSAKTACDAAVMGLQSLTGLVCDTLCGLVQVPCFIRNMTCTSISMVCANAAMAGLDALLPLEEVISASTKLGNRMRSAHCASHTGCDTPTGLRLRAEQDQRFACMRECHAKPQA